MALVVCTNRPHKTMKKIEAVCDTVVFEDEAEGRAFVKANKTFVFSVQKAELIKPKE